MTALQPTTTGPQIQTDVLTDAITRINALLAHRPQDPISLAFLACQQLVTAYAQSEEYDAEIDRSEIDEACATAIKALRLAQPIA